MIDAMQTLKRLAIAIFCFLVMTAKKLTVSSTHMVITITVSRAVKLNTHGAANKPAGPGINKGGIRSGPIVISQKSSTIFVIFNVFFAM